MPSIFLCRANVTVTAYRSDIMSTTDEIRMVQAETEEEHRPSLRLFSLLKAPNTMTPIRLGMSMLAR